MANKYWLGFLPESTMTSAQAMSVVTLGRNLATSTVGKILAAFANACTSTATAANIGTISSTKAGQIEVNAIKFTSGQADVTEILDLSGFAGGIAGVCPSTAAISNIAFSSTNIVGHLKVKMANTAGAALSRYIPLMATAAAS